MTQDQEIKRLRSTLLAMRFACNITAQTLRLAIGREVQDQVTSECASALDDAVAIADDLLHPRTGEPG